MKPSLQYVHLWHTNTHTDETCNYSFYFASAYHTTVGYFFSSNSSFFNSRRCLFSSLSVLLRRNSFKLPKKRTTLQSLTPIIIQKKVPPFLFPSDKHTSHTKDQWLPINYISTNSFETVNTNIYDLIACSTQL